MKKLRGYFREEFIDDKDHIFRFQIGKLIASSLSAFVAGVFFSSVCWLLVLFLINAYR